MLARYDISCDKEEAGTIRLGQLRRQQPASRVEYKEAVEACSSMDYIEYNISQLARYLELDSTNLGKQLRMHYPGAVEQCEEVCKQLGLSDTFRSARGNSARSGMPGP